MELLKDAKKTLIYIGITLVCCGVTCLLTVSIRGSIADKEIARIEQELHQSYVRISELQDSIGARLGELDRENNDFIRELEDARNRSVGLEDRIREQLDSLERERIELENLLQKPTD